MGGMIEDFLFRQHLETVPETPDLEDPEAVHRLWEPIVFEDDKMLFACDRERILEYRMAQVRSRIGRPFGPSGYCKEHHVNVRRFADELHLIPVGPDELAFNWVITEDCPPDRIYMIPKDWRLGR